MGTYNFKICDPHAYTNRIMSSLNTYHRSSLVFCAITAPVCGSMEGPAGGAGAGLRSSSLLSALRCCVRAGKMGRGVMSSG